MSNNTQRYEVVAPMPHFTHLFKGDILVPKQHALCGDCWGHDEETDPLRWVTFCPDFPHLFRPLKWWEGLAIDEMPKFVKSTFIPIVVPEHETISHYGKVYKVVKNNIEELFETGCWIIDELGEDAFIYYRHCVPATEQEYNDYLNKLKTK